MIVILVIFLSEGCGWEVNIFFYFRMIEEVPSSNEKFQKVEKKIGMLTQSKLQNLSEQNLKNTQERINAIERKLMDEITSNETSSNNYMI